MLNVFAEPASKEELTNKLEKETNLHSDRILKRTRFESRVLLSNILLLIFSIIVLFFLFFEKFFGVLDLLLILAVSFSILGYGVFTGGQKRTSVSIAISGIVVIASTAITVVNVGMGNSVDEGFVVICAGAVLAIATYIGVEFNRKNKSYKQNIEASLTEISGLQTIDKKLCKDVLNWCKDYNDLAVYQSKVANLSRPLTCGEYLLFKSYVDEKANNQRESQEKENFELLLKPLVSVS